MPGPGAAAQPLAAAMPGFSAQGPTPWNITALAANMANSPLRGIGGWLLVFIIWTAAGIIAAIGLCLYNLASAQRPGGALGAITIASNILSILWYLVYAWLLKNMFQLKSGSLKPVLFMLIATPIFNLILPGLCGLGAALALPDIGLGALLADIYRGVIAPAFAALIIACCWFVYFLKSQRVAATFPEAARI